MGDQQQGQPVVALQLVQDRDEVALHGQIQRGGRLVGQQRGGSGGRGRQPGWLAGADHRSARGDSAGRAPCAAGNRARSPARAAASARRSAGPVGMVQRDDLIDLIPDAPHRDRERGGDPAGRDRGPGPAQGMPAWRVEHDVPDHATGSGPAQTAPSGKRSSNARHRVLLPQPDGPTTATHSPAARSRSTPREYRCARAGVRDAEVAGR